MLQQFRLNSSSSKEVAIHERDFAECKINMWQACYVLFTYPSWSKEHHTSSDLFGKQHKVVCFQILSPSISKIIPILNSSAFSQVTKQVTAWHVFHEENWMNWKQRKIEFMLNISTQVITSHCTLKVMHIEILKEVNPKWYNSFIYVPQANNHICGKCLPCVVTQPMNFTMFGWTLSPRSFPSSISLIKHFLPSSPAVAKV